MAFLWRLFFIVALSCLPFGATAQESASVAQQPGAEAQHPDAKTAKTGVGIVCDTPQEIERYLKLHIAGAEPSDALARVNSEAHNPTACGIVATAFFENKEISTLPMPRGILRLVQITVLATRNALGWQRVPPTVQYTALFIKAEEV